MSFDGHGLLSVPSQGSVVGDCFRSGLSSSGISKDRDVLLLSWMVVGGAKGKIPEGLTVLPLLRLRTYDEGVNWRMRGSSSCPGENQPMTCQEVVMD